LLSSPSIALIVHGLSGLAFLKDSGTSSGESIRVAIVIGFRVDATRGSHLQQALRFTRDE
jgi:hypothetical protein